MPNQDGKRKVTVWCFLLLGRTGACHILRAEGNRWRLHFPDVPTGIATAKAAK